MKIYCFSTNIESNYYEYGTGEENRFETKAELIQDCESHIGKLTEEEEQAIITKDVPDYDYYSIQVWAYGETGTVATFKTEEECRDFYKKYPKDENEILEIVGQCWGRYYTKFDE